MQRNVLDVASVQLYELLVAFEHIFSLRTANQKAIAVDEDVAELGRGRFALIAREDN